MKMSAAFPSEYLRAADLEGRQVKVKIDRVEMKELGGELKPIVYFVGKDKGVVLNKTNAGAIAAAYGDESDEWQDAEVILFEAMVDFQGKTGPAIRIKVPPRAPVRREPTRSRDDGDPRHEPDSRGSAPVRPMANAALDDDIPFAANFS